MRIMISSIMIVHDLHSLRSGVRPSETNAILLVDPDTMLPLPITLQQFQAISRGNTQRLKPSCRVKLIQLTPGDVPEIGRTNSPRRLGIAAIKDILCPQIRE